jgi:hypothetical protein
VFNLTEQSEKYEPSVPSPQQMQTGRLDTTFSGGVGSQDYGRFLADKPIQAGGRMSGGICWSLPSLFKKKRSTKRRSTKRKARKTRQQKRR